MSFRTLMSLGAAAAVVVVLSGCGADAPRRQAAPADSVSNVSASAELVGQGTVLQKDGSPAELCLGPVAESYPPQCSGPVINGWDWSAVEQSESASGVTWGTYAVFGTWDGTEFTSTRAPIPLSLYDAMPFEDPRLSGGRTGAGDEPQLQRIQQELHASGDPAVLSSWTTQGFLVVSVIYDAGDIQRSLDERFGPDLILVQPALRPAG
ncbi:hypothetical protein I6N91_02770 [Arthrobacter sp. MSA 4-2]|uniref:hypothetical protein n=1 Tax=Arthrobacter sp. MSA 4-2 TaxID=2794349 RepID=UPI0018E8CDA1|nr:hypothetical protein [Arthrobacter sp. MSA 4-2]MBJ2119904.1 hypothetical protein [Arthrobacter sp. MSA 4-2]